MKAGITTEPAVYKTVQVCLTIVDVEIVIFDSTESEHQFGQFFTVILKIALTGY